MSDNASRETPDGIRMSSDRAGLIAGLIAGAAVAIVVGVLIWALASRSGDQQTRVEAPRFDRFEAAWSSAMRKASVEATFPAEPVDVTTLRARGRRSFEATFSSEEIGALLNVYVFETVLSGRSVALSDASVSFPEDGAVALKGGLVSGGSRYSMDIVSTVTYALGEIRGAPTSLQIEGFTVKGEKRRQAGVAVFDYLNRFLDEAPGLTVQSASVADGVLTVRGWAPVALEPAAAVTPGQ